MPLSILLMVFVGGLGLSAQQAMNARLRVGVGSPALSALVSFLVGAVALVVVTLSGVLGKATPGGAASVPWWAWLGGLMGAFYVTAAVVAVPRIGTALVVAGAVGGQLIAALVLDTFGWMGVPKVPFSPSRLIGAVLLFAGVLLLQRKG